MALAKQLQKKSPSPIAIPLHSIPESQLIEHLQIAPICSSLEAHNIYERLKESRQTSFLTIKLWKKIIEKVSFVEALILLQDMKKNSINPDSDIYALLLEKCHTAEQVLKIYRYAKSRHDYAELMTNRYLTALVEGLLRFRKEQIIPEVWDDMRLSRTHFSIDLLRLFSKTCAIIRDELFLQEVHKFLERRLVKQRWIPAIYCDLMEAYLYLDQYQTVIDLFHRMGKIRLSEDILKSVLPAYHYIGDKEQLKIQTNVFTEIILRDNIEIGTASLTALILNSPNLDLLRKWEKYARIRVQYEIKKRKSQINNDIQEKGPKISWVKVFNSLIQAYATFDNHEMVFNTVKYYAAVRKNLHEGPSTIEMCEKGIHGMLDKQLNFMTWNHPEIPRQIMITVVTYFASKRDSKMICNFLKEFLFDTDLMNLYWSRNLSSHLYEAREKIENLKEKIKRRKGRPLRNELLPIIQINTIVNEIRSLKFKTGIHGPLRVVYEALSKSWIDSLESMKESETYSFDLVRKNEIIDQLCEMEIKSLEGTEVFNFFSNPTRKQIWQWLKLDEQGNIFSSDNRIDNQTCNDDEIKYLD